jgi:hypothetical protein
MLSTCVKGIEYPSTNLFIFLDKATRLTAGPRRSALRYEPLFQIEVYDRQFQTLANLSPKSVTSGDDGDRTRGLRLAKALLSR